MNQPATLVERLRAGDHLAVSRAISLVENERPGFEALLAAIHGSLGRAQRVGVTGPPGAGKSTLVHQLVREWRGGGLSVAVVAVDPTSPVTGGALLGDRIRMEPVALDPGVFIRSMATRGALGGVALATREVCDLLDAAGFDRIVVETVGVGQSELEVVSVTDTVVLVLTPESGDGIQALKSGLMEVADLFVVNKADRPGAARLLKEIEFALHLAPAGGDGAWRRPVRQTSAATGEGIAAVREDVERHLEWLRQSGELDTRRRNRLAAQTREVVRRAVLRWTREFEPIVTRLAAGEARVAEGAATPYEIAEEILRQLPG